MKKTLIITVLFIFFIFIPAVLAQGDNNNCPVVIEEALDRLDEVCQGTGRNQACYGNLQLEATARSGIESFDFDAPGDIVNLTDISTMQLSPLDVEAGVWGVSLLQVQANLPDTLPGQNVTMLLFGDVEFENAPEVDNMQAYYFRTGIGDAPCEEAPESGILIQTPEGVGEVSLMINEVAVTLGSTAYLQSENEGDMTISLLEGEAQLTVEETVLSVPAGALARIPMTRDRRPRALPAIEFFETERFRNLPLKRLKRQIQIARVTGKPIITGLVNFPDGILPGDRQRRFFYVNFANPDGDPLSDINIFCVRSTAPEGCDANWTFTMPVLERRLEKGNWKLGQIAVPLRCGGPASRNYRHTLGATITDSEGNTSPPAFMTFQCSNP